MLLRREVRGWWGSPTRRQCQGLQGWNSAFVHVLPPPPALALTRRVGQGQGQAWRAWQSSLLSTPPSWSSSSLPSWEVRPGPGFKLRCHTAVSALLSPESGRRSLLDMEVPCVGSHPSGWSYLLHLAPLQPCGPLTQASALSPSLGTQSNPPCPSSQCEHP